MLYGIILESARDGVIVFHGENVWKRIVHELRLPSDTFQPFARYDKKLLFDICECKTDAPALDRTAARARRHGSCLARWDTCWIPAILR